MKLTLNPSKLAGILCIAVGAACLYLNGIKENEIAALVAAVCVVVGIVIGILKEPKEKPKV